MMNKKCNISNSYSKILFVRLGVLLLGLFVMTSAAQADPPRVLHTSFDEYARQQQQHDQNLAQERPANNTSASSPSSANTTVNKNPATTKKATTGKTLASQKSSTPININTADESSLSNTLVGVGPAKARAIVEYRQQNGKFKQPEDLLAVKGIGPATLEKNRSRIRLN